MFSLTIRSYTCIWKAEDVSICDAEIADLYFLLLLYCSLIYIWKSSCWCSLPVCAFIPSYMFPLLQQSLFGDVPNYLSAGVPPSKFPERHFCSVCGYPLLLLSINYIILELVFELVYGVILTVKTWLCIIVYPGWCWIHTVKIVALLAWPWSKSYVSSLRCKSVKSLVDFYYI